jgi:hypothetical protein
MKTIKNSILSLKGFFPKTDGFFFDQNAPNLFLLIKSIFQMCSVAIFWVGPFLSYAAELSALLATLGLGP